MNDRARRSFARTNLSPSSSKTASDALARRHKPDYWLLVLSALLMTMGLVVVYSISPGLAASQGISQNYFITKQLLDVGLGLAGFAMAAFLPIKFWQKITTPLAIAAIACCVVVMFMPLDEVYRAHRWIRVGEFSFQVAELVKFALLVWAADFLAQRWKEGTLGDFKATIRPVLVVLLLIGIVVAKLQSDLGSAAVMIAMLGLMCFSVGIPMKKILLFGGMIVILGVLAVATSDYRRDRLGDFLHPGSTCQDTGYQACQALISVGSGGLFGLGLGYSVQAYGYLPEASDDSIFAIIAEKFGFIGTASVVVIYGVFIARIKRVIEHTSNQFNRLLAVGVLAWLSTQMIINIGAMLGLLPLKGITLPLISQGGTSLVFLTAAIGLVFHISRYTNYNVTEPETNRQNFSGTSGDFDGRRLRRPHNAPLVSRPRSQG